MENAKNNTADYLRGELKKVKEGLYSFRHSTNVYEKKIYQDKEQDVLQALDKLENFSVDNTNQPSGLFQPKVIIPVVLVALVLTAAVVVIIRNRRRKQ